MAKLKIILLLASFFTVHLSLATPLATPLTTAELKALIADLPIIDEVREFSCQANDPELPSKLFLFEGARGFCPYFFILNTVQKDGGTLAARLTETTRSPENSAFLYQIDTRLKEEKLVRNCALVKTVLSNFGSRIREKRLQVLYYSKTGNNEALTCARKLLAENKNNEKFRLKVLAYSMGAEAALQFAIGLEAAENRIDDLLTIDPVGKKMNWTTGVIGNRDNPIFTRPANIGVWNNYYQKVDHFCLMDTPLLHFGIRGSFGFGADFNREILSEDFSSLRSRRRAHVSILSQPSVLNAMDQFF